MKPIQTGNTTLDTVSTLESSTMNPSESTKSLDETKETLELNSKTFSVTEQTNEGLFVYKNHFKLI